MRKSYNSWLSFLSSVLARLCLFRFGTTGGTNQHSIVRMINQLCDESASMFGLINVIDSFLKLPCMFTNLAKNRPIFLIMAL